MMTRNYNKSHCQLPEIIVKISQCARATNDSLVEEDDIVKVGKYKVLISSICLEKI